MRIITLAMIITLFMLGSANAHTVTMNLAFHIGDTKEDDTIHVNDENLDAGEYYIEHYENMEKKYISSEENGIVIGIVFGGSKFLSASLNTPYSNEDYLLEITQDDKENRFIIPMTKGSWVDIDNHAEEKLTPKTYGILDYKKPAVFLFNSRLGFNDIDLVGSASIVGEKKLYVKNLGKYQGKQRIEIGAIE